MGVVQAKTRYEPMAATVLRARKLLRMSQVELSEALKIDRQSIGQIERTRRYPSRSMVEQFAELFDVNLEVYDWARNPANADALPGLLGLVPLHIVRLYERRLVDASVRNGHARPVGRKSSSERLTSLA
jgi:transcriptional regulator with XRE-family HTH domain